MGPATYKSATLLQHDTICIESVRKSAGLFRWLWRWNVSHQLTDAMQEPVGSVESVKEHPDAATPSLLHVFDEPQGEQPLLEIASHPDEMIQAVSPWFNHYRGALARNTQFQVWDYKPRRLVGELQLSRSWLTGIPALKIFDNHSKPLGEITRDTSRMLLNWWHTRPLKAAIDHTPYARIEETASVYGFSSMRIDFARNAAGQNARKLCLAAAIILHRNQQVRLRGYT